MKQKIKLTGEQAQFAFKSWTRQHGLLDATDYVGIEKRGPQAFAVAFVELDLDTFKARLCKVKEMK